MHGDAPHDQTAAPVLSVIVPVHNESATIATVVQKILKLDLNLEIIIVDDGSLDGTAATLRSLAADPRVRVLSHESNRGKGAAVRTGLGAARGAIIALQDADLEYDPAELPRLMAPILAGEAGVVFGTRFDRKHTPNCKPHRRWANQGLTWLANQVSGLRLTDMETGAKVMRREVAMGMQLEEERFGIEPELTLKIARGGWQVLELPVSYQARDYADGKKIGWRDGLRAIWCIFRYSRWD